MNNENFSDRLRQAMELKNISLSQLGQKSGISKSTISGYLSGQYVAKTRQIEKLAAQLECDPRWLQGQNSEPEYHPGTAEECELDVYHSIGADCVLEPQGRHSAAPEYCDGRHFFLKLESMPENELLLCRHQELIRGGQTGVFIDRTGCAMMLRCELRSDAVCLFDVSGGRVFINEETENLKPMARVMMYIREL